MAKPHFEERFDNVYSSDEVVVGKYDGKPLYRKKIILPNGNEGETTQVVYYLSDFGINNVQEIYLVQPSYYSLNDSRYPFNFYDGSRFEAQVTPTLLRIIMEYAPIASSRCVITVEYTKTTD